MKTTIPITARLAALLTAFALFAVTAEGQEEYMPLAPGAGDAAQRTLDAADDATADKPRPALRKNTIKLKFPSPGDSNYRMVEAKTDTPDGFIDFNIPEPAGSYIPPPPSALPKAKPEPAPEAPIIMPSARTATALRPPASAADSPAFSTPGSNAATAAAMAAASAATASASTPPKVTSAKITLASTLPKQPTPPRPQPVPSAASPIQTAAKSFYVQNAPAPSREIPGLITPEQLAIGKGGAASSLTHAGIGVAGLGVPGRDDLADLIAFGGQSPGVGAGTGAGGLAAYPAPVSVQADGIFSTEPARRYTMVSQPAISGDIMAMAAPMPEFPAMGDPYIATLEPFQTAPEPTLPQPNPLSVPAPISKNSATFHSAPPRQPHQELLPIPSVSAVRQPPARTSATVHHYPSTSVLGYPSSLTPPARSNEAVSAMGLSAMAAPSPVVTVAPASNEIHTPPSPTLTGTSPPYGNNSQGGTLTGPLLLPIPPMLGGAGGAPPMGTIAAGAASTSALAGLSGGLDAGSGPGMSVYNHDPAPRQGMMPVPEMSLPSALTPTEFAALEEVGFPPPPRPTARRGPPPEMPPHPDAVVEAKPKGRAPPKSKGRPAAKVTAKQPENNPKKRAKAEGFTNMRDVKQIVGPPDPRLFSTKANR